MLAPTALSMGMEPAPVPAPVAAPGCALLLMVVRTASTPHVQVDVVFPTVNTSAQPDSMFSSVDLPSLHRQS